MRWSEEPATGWSRNKALVILAVVTIALAIMSEVLTGAIEPASESLHLTPQFAGVFLLALVGNAAEIFNAVRFARKDQMDLAIGITAGAEHPGGPAGAPGAGLPGHDHGPGHGPDLLPLELIAIVMAIYLTRNLTYDGESSWLEGLMLIAVYVLFGIRVPPPPPGRSAQSADRPPGRRGAPVIDS